MVTKRKWAKRTKRKAKFMPKGLASKRYNATDTKTFFFKNSGVAESSQGALPPAYYTSFKSHELYTNGLLHPQFTNFRKCYDQYKCLGMKVRFFPCAVGLEPRYTTTGLPSILNRGNLIVWNDQQFDATVQAPSEIADVINDSSARMLNARSKFTRVISRPKGQPFWGNCNATTEPDPWNGCINVLVDGATRSPPNPNPAVQLYYWTITYKVIFRGRQT